MMIRRLIRRQPDTNTTIISRETIKPSSPTPCHLRTYNLSDLDLLNPKANIPLILFYPNNPDCTLTALQRATLLKNSLSRTLTPHYPFAGRLPTPTTPSYIDCNDEGVVFVEASNHSPLQAFKHMTGQDQTLSQLFADGIVHSMPRTSTNLVRVQVNHFACGGVGLAVSMSHLIGDACSLGSFLSHWASVARHGSSDHKPHFIHSLRADSIQTEPETKPRARDVIVAARRFVFPNSKLSELKNKIMCEAGGCVNNVTRVEALTSLLYKTGVVTKPGGLKPSCLFSMVNMRNKFVKKLPETTIGNFVSLMMVPTSESSLSTVVAEIKKQKLRFEGIESVQQLAERSRSLRSNVNEGSYFCSSFCGFPFNKLDFGWGRPMGTTLATRSTGKNGFVLMDVPDGDGIEALVMLEEKHMERFENDKDMHMLLFCKTN